MTTLYRRTDQREQSGERLATATGMYREMDMRFWLEQAEERAGLRPADGRVNVQCRSSAAWCGRGSPSWTRIELSGWLRRWTSLVHS